MIQGEAEWIRAWGVLASRWDLSHQDASRLWRYDGSDCVDGQWWHTFETMHAKLGRVRDIVAAPAGWAPYLRPGDTMPGGVW